MALSINDREVENLIEHIVQVTGETKIEAVRIALTERYQRLARPSMPKDRRKRLLQFLENEVWPQIPSDQRGRRLSKEEEEAILGIGEAGV
ncbi:MAG: type II toxin-antitoxin system VapB family antitoxin [Chloroflexi bacterium]|nr:type II toxin-antitoxin system VapB family antitoxin [Chloroflexota bacterium]